MLAGAPTGCIVDCGRRALARSRAQRVNPSKCARRRIGCCFLQRCCWSGIFIRAGGVPTRHTHKWDGLHTRHLLESTHTKSQTHTNTHKHTVHVIPRARALTPQPRHRRRSHPRSHPRSSRPRRRRSRRSLSDLVPKRMAPSTRLEQGRGALVTLARAAALRGRCRRGWRAQSRPAGRRPPRRSPAEAPTPSPGAPWPARA